jgi:hypothetical protein
MEKRMENEEKARKDVNSGSSKEKRMVAVQENVDRQRMTVRVNKEVFDKGMKEAEKKCVKIFTKKKRRCRIRRV